MYEPTKQSGERRLGCRTSSKPIPQCRLPTTWEGVLPELGRVVRLVPPPHCDAHPCISEVCTEAPLSPAAGTACAAACFVACSHHQRRPPARATNTKVIPDLSQNGHGGGGGGGGGSDDSEHAVSVQGHAYVQLIGEKNTWEQAPGVPATPSPP